MNEQLQRAEEILYALLEVYKQGEQEEFIDWEDIDFIHNMALNYVEEYGEDFKGVFE